MSNSDLTAKREYGETPNGNPIAGRWVVRDSDGKFIDVDKYRNDLQSRYRNRITFVGD